MSMIKCGECGNDISDKEPDCYSCGAPVTGVSTQPNEGTETSNSLKGDLNGDGKVDFEDFKIALSRSKQYASDKVDAAKKFCQEKLQSAKEKDAAAIDDLAKEFRQSQPVEQTESEVNRDKFKAALLSTIDLKFADIMRTKNGAEAYLSYVDAQTLTSSIRNIFRAALNVTPPQVDSALMLSEAVLAPSTKEKANLFKAAIGIGGGTAGIGMVVAAVGSALGWGASVWGVVTSVFTTAHLTGPIGVGVAGLSLAAIAGYFASTSNNQTDTERFMRVLKGSTGRAVDAIWEQHELVLSKTVAQAATVDSGSAK